METQLDALGLDPLEEGAEGKFFLSHGVFVEDNKA